MTLRVRTKDTVFVLAGKARGKRGRLLRLSKNGKRGFVEGVNLVKRHLKPTRQNPQRTTVEQEASIELSNLALYCDKCGKATRFRNQVLKDGSKTRICVKCQSDLNLG